MLEWLRNEGAADRVKRWRSQNRREVRWKEAVYNSSLARYRGDPNGWVRSAGEAREKCKRLGFYDEKDTTVEIRE